MRPSDALGRGRPRSGDNEVPPSSLQPAASGGPQMTYFLADEATVDAALEQSLATLHSSRDARKPFQQSKSPPARSSSLNSGPSVGADAGRLEDEDEDGDRERSHNRCGTEVKASRDEDSRPATPSYYRPTGTPTSQALPSLSSQPMTPIMFGTSGATSALSSSSSRRQSLSESLSEELGASSLGLAGDAATDQSVNMLDSGSAPQLVMPSIKMPSRRPFTEEGKNMGRLKVLLAGDSGVGKTSLIKAIVQSCEHIVHVDPITPPTSSTILKSSQRLRRSSKLSRSEYSTSQITEIYASTKPYPEWWSDLDDFGVLRRRKSLGDTVLDRNLCFVDTPGYGVGSSSMETITPVIQYVESYLQKLSSNTLDDSDLLGMVGGGGGSQVDVVFYLIANKVKPADLHFMRSLASMTNLIPLLAHMDTLSQEQLVLCKEEIASQMQDAGIRPFNLGHASPPYAISSAPGSDHDIMDASLLMSPDYVQPLVPSELSAFVERVFSQNGVSWLRHAAARRFVQWKEIGNPSRPQALYRPLSYPSIPGRSLENTTILTPAMGPSSTFALARINDHTQREERMAQIRLANWAAELQRSLANERARYESVARNERAVWLTEKLNECVQDGTLVALPGRERSGSHSRLREEIKHRLGGRKRSATRTLQHQDPLGLLEITAGIKAKSWVVLEVLGSLSVLGGLAFWVGQQYLQSPTYEMMIDEWGKFWYGERS